MLSKKLWAVLLAAVLVVGLLVGFGDGDRAMAKEPRATLGKIMVPAAAFIAADDTYSYSNNGWFLGAITGSAAFSAPLSFPVPVVNIRKITLMARDSTASNNVCATLYRAQPLGATETQLGDVCTVNSPADPQKVATSAISPRKVNTVNHGPYLWVNIGQNTHFYGVQVVYSY